VLRTEKLTKRFGTLTAVDGVDLEVREGEVFGYLGPNGAGKTTTLRMLAGLIAATTGHLELEGRPVSARSATRGYICCARESSPS